MSGSRKRLQKANDSRSLWNYTLSPGWTEEAGDALRKAIMRYGCGNWQKIQRHFPDKTNGQLNLQTQRLFGQQSLSTWTRVHVDPLKIKAINQENKDAFRKNGNIVNTGGYLPPSERNKIRKQNEQKWGMKPEEYLRIKVPFIQEERVAIGMHDKIKQLKQYYQVYTLMKRHQDMLKKGRIVSKDGKGYVDKNDKENNRVFSGVNDELLRQGNKNKNRRKGTKKTNIRKSAKKNTKKRKTTTKRKSAKKNTRSKKKVINKNTTIGRKRKTMEDSDGNDDNDNNNNSNNNNNDDEDGMPPAKKQKMMKKTEDNNDDKDNDDDDNDNNEEDVAVRTKNKSVGNDSNDNNDNDENGTEEEDIDIEM